ncbi:hypothetical protein C2E31_11780 [Rhodopirellula baltica]|nr:hypothetical protein C2E31_11780 [Rhodopirellula baltica]
MLAVCVGRSCLFGRRDAIIKHSQPQSIIWFVADKRFVLPILLRNGSCMFNSRKSFAICTLLAATTVVAHEGHHDHSHGENLVVAATGNPAGAFQSKVTMTEANGVRTIRSNGLPEHATGQFPGPRNPNRIQEQRYEFRMPLNPQPASKPQELKLGKFGVAVNGVPIDPGAAEFWRRDFQSPWQYAVINGKIDLGLDMNSAHVQPGGEYHYHGRPADLISRLREQARKENRSMTLVATPPMAIRSMTVK